MKKNIFRNFLTVIAAGSFLTMSCTGNFEKLNTHPTDPNSDVMSSVEKVGNSVPELLYLLQQKQENRSQHTDQIVYGQLGGYYSVPNPFNNHGGKDHQIASYNPQETMYRGPFTDYLDDFYATYFKIEYDTNASGAVYLVANVLRVAVMHRIADTYGPIPYSKVGSGAFKVEYDSLEELYPRFIADLSKAIESLQSYAGTTSAALAEYDVMFGGDFSKWLKFANSLKFRLAMRYSSVDVDLAKKAMGEAVLAGMLIKSEDNPKLASDDNPVYKAAISWGDLDVNASITAYMTQYNDPRLGKYFKPNNGGYYNGMRLGYMPGQHGGGNHPYAKPNLTQSSDLPVFYAAESWFLMAEAALKGYISGNAEEFYNEGIKASMAQWGADMGSYMTERGGTINYTDSNNSSNNYTIQNVPGVAWSSESSTEGHLKQIMTQKYIANYPLGLESWSDFRRTGYPEMIPTVYNRGTSEGVTLQRGLRRLKYPDSEYAQNEANCKAAVASYLGGQDKLSVDLIWAKTN